MMKFFVIKIKDFAIWYVVVNVRCVYVAFVKCLDGGREIGVYVWKTFFVVRVYIMYIMYIIL